MFYFPNTVMKYLMLFQVVWNSETDFERFCRCTSHLINIKNLPTRWVKTIHLFQSHQMAEQSVYVRSITDLKRAGLWWQVVCREGSKFRGSLWLLSPEWPEWFMEKWSIWRFLDSLPWIPICVSRVLRYNRNRCVLGHKKYYEVTIGYWME